MIRHAARLFRPRPQPVAAGLYLRQLQELRERLARAETAVDIAAVRFDRTAALVTRMAIDNTMTADALLRIIRWRGGGRIRARKATQ